MKAEVLEKLGEPDLRLAGLQIWVHGREFEDSKDYSDANWLWVTAHCGGSGASVFASGSIIHLSEVEGWQVQAEKFLKDMSGEANLECIEPNLCVKLKATTLGHIAMEVSITPDHLTQSHCFRFEIDQSYLPSLIEQCQRVLKAYPIRGAEGEG